ncbi:hypothetical protein [Myxococcus sp. RHSTA-1-4]|uniref:hypothetical protein n=1 Tax=Myxococcus sp. RHSTA-1-4 TaxID=2874601 RepID=UPI001CC133DE|nr:hypothetical protein [Myxococcus sp. RHSTA-1-4]MBZ4416949.1 hypothetical protein [Myxococcus sp. RHSTA-1-4]
MTLDNAGGGGGGKAPPPPKDPFLLSPGLPAPAAPLKTPFPFPWNKVALLVPAPVPDAVAVITLDDKLWLLQLGDEKPRPVEVDDEYLEQVSGGTLRALQPPMPGQLAYLQSRRLVVYDLKWQKAQTWSMANILEEMGVRGSWVSREPLVFVVELEDTTHYLDEDRLDFRLRSFRLQGEKRVELGSLALGSVVGAVKWDAGAGLVAVQRPGAALELYGPDLGKPQPEHPLALALRKLAVDGLSVQSLLLHPARPVALVALGRETPPASGEKGEKKEAAEPGVWRIAWGPEAAAPVRLAKYADGETLTLGALSPEDDWVSYSLEGAGRTHLYAQQVGAVPGRPLALGVVPESGVELLWTGGKTSLVMYDSAKDALTRWRLEGLSPPAKPPAAAPKPLKEKGKDAGATG